MSIRESRSKAFHNKFHLKRTQIQSYILNADIKTLNNNFLCELKCAHFGAHDYCTHIDQRNLPKLSDKLYFMGENLLL